MNAAFGVYDTTYSVAHWVFAAHYYTNSVRIEMLLKRKDPQLGQENMKLLFWTLVVLNSLLPLVEEFGAQQEYYGALKITGVGNALLLQLVSCIFLTLGIFKIDNVVFAQTGSGIKKM